MYKVGDNLICKVSMANYLYGATYTIVDILSYQTNKYYYTLHYGMHIEVYVEISVIHDYFHSLVEMRKMKLESINESG